MRALHVVPCKAAGLWLAVVRGEIWTDGPTKAAVVRWAIEEAKREKMELIVHNGDGKIAYRNSYGGDSPRRKG